MRARPTTSPSPSPSRSCWPGSRPTCARRAPRRRRRWRRAASSSTCSHGRPTRNGISVRLPEREAELLAFLMRRAGQVCTQREILTAVWGYDHDPGTNIVQVYIGYLRRKLGQPGSPAPIETVRSVGYRLNADDEGRLGEARAAGQAGDLDRRRSSSSPSPSSSSPCGRDMADESRLIEHEESREAGDPAPRPASRARARRSRRSPTPRTRSRGRS